MIGSLHVCPAALGTQEPIDSLPEAILTPEHNAAQIGMIDMDVLCGAHCNTVTCCDVKGIMGLQVQRTLAALAASPEGSELEALLWYQVGKHLESVLLWYYHIGDGASWQRSHICCMLVPCAQHVMLSYADRKGMSWRGMQGP